MEVSALDSSRKRQGDGAGVGGLIGHLGDGLKARPGPLVLVEKELHICLKTLYPFFLALMLGFTSSGVLKPVLLQVDCCVTALINT